MKTILILTKTNMKRNIFAVLLSIIGAGMLCLILYSMGNLVADLTLVKISIGVIDYDESALSEDFKEYMNQELNYELLEGFTYDELSTQLIDKKISVIIEIPKDFYAETLAGNQAEVMITSMEDYENSAFVEAYINSYMSSISILSVGASGDQELFDQLLSQYDKKDIEITRTAAMSVDKEKITGEGGFINSVGFFLMFIFSISVLVAFMVLEDRFSGVYSRIQVTPVKPIQYIIGTGIFGMILCMIQIGLYSIYIDVMDIETGIPLGIIVLMMTLFSLFTICFSLSISLALKSKNAITSIIIGFSTVGCILGGAYFSLDMAPKSLQNLARILPQYWFMDAFRRIQADIHANIYPNIIIMSLFIVLSFLVGAVLFSQNYKNS